MRWTRTFRQRSAATNGRNPLRASFTACAARGFRTSERARKEFFVESAVGEKQHLHSGLHPFSQKGKLPAQKIDRTSLRGRHKGGVRDRPSERHAGENSTGDT